MKLTSEQIIAALVAANVPQNKHAAIVADLLTKQDESPVDPPISQDELKQILRAINSALIEEWPAWPTRGRQARRQFPALFSAYDAALLAGKALGDEVVKLGG